MELDLHYGVGGVGGGGVPYGMYNKLTRMTTVLGLNDKFLTYPSDNSFIEKNSKYLHVTEKIESFSWF